MPYNYRIKSTENNSSKFGDCEICKKSCSEIFIQSETRCFKFEGKIHETYSKTNSHTFGHEICLINSRR